MSRFLEGVADDLPGFFTELGETVVYTPNGGLARDARVIIGTSVEPSEFGERRVDGVARWARVVSADLPELAQGDQFTVAGALYSVDGVEPDRAGTVKATLIADAP